MKKFDLFGMFASSIKRALRSFIILQLSLVIPVCYLHAQEIPKDKEFSWQTSGGIDIFTGQFKIKSIDLSVGSGEFPSRLDFIRENGQYPRQQQRAYVTSNFHLTALCSPCQASFSVNKLIVKSFDGVHTFEGAYVTWGSPRTWINKGLDGAEVIDNGGTLEFRSKNGDEIFFAATYPDGTGIGCGGNCRLPVYARIASGESIVFSYDDPSTTGFSLSRLSSVLNSRGYGFKLEYLNQSLTDGDPNQRRLLTSVKSYRSGCLAIVVNCDNPTLPQVHYTWLNVGLDSSGQPLYRMSSFTNSIGRVLNYEYNGPDYRMTSATFADDPYKKIFQNIYRPNDECDEGKVVEQKDALSKSTFYETLQCFQSPRDRPTSSVTYPDGEVVRYSFTAVFGGGTIGLPTLIEASLSRTLRYAYSSGRLQSSTDAEGVQVSFELDSRGNATKTTTVPKSGLIGDASELSASFPACNSTNFRICNKPSHTVDARGFRTDYSYDLNDGQLRIKLAPANTAGTRAITRYKYSTFQQGPGVIPPSGITLNPVSLLESSYECLVSSVTGTTIDFEYDCPATERVEIVNLYTPSSLQSRTNFELEGVLIRSNTEHRRVCYKYDVVGNRVAETTARAELETCN